MRRARVGQAGPAVVGFVAPRMVLPDDYESRFTEAERAMIRAHERAHIERMDPRANTLMAIAQCLCWFNPLVHLAVREARLDQELACDARVMERLSREKGLYARTLLKTQLGASALPLGCHWPAAAPHPLEERVGMLARPLPSLRRAALGGVVVASMSLTAAVGAWATQPPGPPIPKAEPIKWPVVVYAQIEVSTER
jgi:beta-lactamase regulating signal transducer with metallopeptidase domain